MIKLKILDKLLEIMPKKEEAYYDYKATGSEEDLNKYRAFDKEMNDLINELVSVIHAEENMTAPEIPTQEQCVKTNEIHIDATDFQKIVALLGVILKPIDFTEKFKIELNHDPNNSKVELIYLKKEAAPKVPTQEQPLIIKTYEDKLKNGTSIKTTTSVTITDFSKEDCQDILTTIARDSHSFYIEVANEIKNKLL